MRNQLHQLNQVCIYLHRVAFVSTIPCSVYVQEEIRNNLPLAFCSICLRGWLLLQLFIGGFLDVPCDMQISYLNCTTNLVVFEN